MVTLDDIAVARLAESALDVSEAKLRKRDYGLLSELFVTSPHSGRRKGGMIKSRVALTTRLIETLHRGEIDDTLNGDPILAAQVIRLLDELREVAQCVRAECERAVQGGTAL